MFDADDKLVSVLHIWTKEPNGTFRVNIRGCESSGWIDSARFFCEGTINPSTSVYRWFDTRKGTELGEAIGSGFIWSPDKTELAHFGNVPLFSPADSKSDSLCTGTLTWPAESSPEAEQHWFRSHLSWSEDGKFVAVVDHQRRIQKAFVLEIVARGTNIRTERQLNLPDETDEWLPDHDFAIEWTAAKVSVRHAGTVQSFPL